MAIEPALTHDGVEIAAHDLGGRGPVLLMGHATGYCGGVWRPVAERLGDSFRCVAVDSRGHGQSGRLGQSPSWERLADDMLAVIDALDPPHPVYGAGHSAGAAALILAEAARPGTFAGLWCFEPVLFPPPPQAAAEPPPNPMAEAARRRRCHFASREEALTHFGRREPFERFDQAALGAFVACGLQPDESGVGFRLSCLPEDESQIYEMGGFERTWPAPTRLSCHTTFVTGDQGRAFGAAHAEQLSSRCPAGRAEVLAGLSHFGPLERPRVVASSIRAAFAAGTGTP